MKNSIILTLAILFSACATPHIEHTQDNLLCITMKNKFVIQGEGKPLLHQKTKLLNLNIEQTVFEMDDKSILTYEDAIADAGYKFKYGMQKTVGIIFSDYNYELVDIKGNIHFFKLLSQDKVEYLILENMNKKRIKFIYGLNKNIFNGLLKVLSDKETTPLCNIISSGSNEILKDKNAYIKSSWNMNSSVLNNLIMKVGSGIRQL